MSCEHNQKALIEAVPSGDPLPLDLRSASRLLRLVPRRVR